MYILCLFIIVYSNNNIITPAILLFVWLVTSANTKHPFSAMLHQQVLILNSFQLPAVINWVIYKLNNCVEIFVQIWAKTMIFEAWLMIQKEFFMEFSIYISFLHCFEQEWCINHCSKDTVINTCFCNRLVLERTFSSEIINDQISWLLF